MDIGNKASKSREGRIQGYDLARGVAVFAMIIIDFKSFFCVSTTFPEWLYALIDYMDRRAAVALVMIAGAGMTLMSRRTGIQRSRQTLLKRAVFLLLAGVLLSRIWPADILHFYGLFILAGLAVLPFSDSGLLTGAALFWLAGFVTFFDGVSLCLESLTECSLPGLFADLFFTGFYPVFPWAALYLLGMWLGRQDLKNRRVAIVLLVSGLLTAVLSQYAQYFIPGLAAKAVLAHGGSDATAANIFVLLSKLTEMDLALPSPVSVISGAATGLCVITLSFIWTAGLKQGPPQFLLIAGRTTLSLYVMHALIIEGLELVPGIREDYPVLWVAAGAVLFAAACTSLMRLWLKKFAMGPLEAAMRHYPCFIALKKIKKTARHRPGMTPFRNS